MTDLKRLITSNVRAVVNHPDAVKVTQEEAGGDDEVLFRVSVHPSDVGQAIGREGRIAESLRHIVKAAARRNGQKANVSVEAPVISTP